MTRLSVEPSCEISGAFGMVCGSETMSAGFETGQVGEPDAQQIGLVHKMEPPKRNLGPSQAGLRQFDFAVEPGIDTVGLDLNQSEHEAGL
jgi:hypothetical protein